MKNTVYIEYCFKVLPFQPTSDILIAELGAAGFESFVEEENTMLAYIQKEGWSSSILDEIEVLRNTNFDVQYTFKEIKQENWNATWEQNFKPIIVDEMCMVRAPFHEKKDVAYDIVIEPKMSFGTGHHETTYMMLQYLLQLEVKSKSVLDMGCGTGVLAILTAMKGAEELDAIDIDNWCYVNTKENIVRNKVPFINVYEGDASLLKNQQYDLIIANINRNILLRDIPLYVNCLRKGGNLLLSGFYSEDLGLITEKCSSMGLQFEKKLEKNNWVAANYVF